jgi:hypothetical protein
MSRLDAFGHGNISSSMPITPYLYFPSRLFMAIADILSPILSWLVGYHDPVGLASPDGEHGQKYPQKYPQNHPQEHGSQNGLQYMAHFF